MKSDTLKKWFDKYRTSESEDWYGRFDGIITDSDMAARAVFEFKAIVGDTPIVIYGAGHVGNAFERALVKMNLKVLCFVDNNTQITEKAGRPVYTYEYFSRNFEDEKYLMFLTVGRVTYTEIADTLVIPYYDGLAAMIILRSALCTLDLSKGKEHDFIPCFKCAIVNNACEVMRNKLKDFNGYDTSKARPHSSKNLKMIGYVLGQVCTLNCAQCCESIPYFPKEMRKQVPTESVINDIQKVTSGIEFLTILEFVGGEPFLHKGLAEIMRTVLTIDNVGLINVFTNGTVLPTDELCKVLNHKKVTVYVSNYTSSLSDSHKEKVEATEKKLTYFGVNYLFGDAKRWFDFHGYDLVCDDETLLPDRYTNCFIRTCNRLHNGVLYHCAHHYAGDVLGVIPKGRDVVRIHD